MRTLVYSITNRSNGKAYFAKTVDVATRWYRHCWDAKNGKSLPIHRAIRKYGKDAFEVTTLAEHSTEAEACEHVIELIASADPSQCYNAAAGGVPQVHLRHQPYIPATDHAKFLELFHQGVPIIAMMAFFDVPYSSVERCAERLGVSFLRRGNKL